MDEEKPKKKRRLNKTNLYSDIAETTIKELKHLHPETEEKPGPIPSNIVNQVTSNSKVLTLEKPIPMDIQYTSNNNNLIVENSFTEEDQSNISYSDINQFIVVPDSVENTLSMDISYSDINQFIVVPDSVEKLPSMDISYSELNAPPVDNQNTLNIKKKSTKNTKKKINR